MLQLIQQICSLGLIEGDIVVMGSNGLFDNIFDHEIISALSGSQDVSEAGLFRVLNSQFGFELFLLTNMFLVMVANKLANLAHYHSMDSNFDSPYSLEARSRVLTPCFMFCLLSKDSIDALFHNYHTKQIQHKNLK